MSDMTSTKPYVIAKRAVWEAYQQVKANRGAAGIDDETIVMFEQNLSRNLYKLWNRMSSGSYFPPPVKQVEIPKAKGGTRKLGIPTVSDRIAQTVVKRIIEPMLDPIFHPDSYGYRPGRSAKQALAVTTYFPFITCTKPSADTHIKKVIALDTQCSGHDVFPNCYFMGVFGKSTSAPPVARP